MLLFYDSRSGGEYSKGPFSLACILRLAGYEEDLQKLWPILACVILSVSQNIPNFSYPSYQSFTYHHPNIV